MTTRRIRRVAVAILAAWLEAPGAIQGRVTGRVVQVGDDR